MWIGNPRWPPMQNNFYLGMDHMGKIFSNYSYFYNKTFEKLSDIIEFKMKGCTLQNCLHSSSMFILLCPFYFFICFVKK